MKKYYDAVIVGCGVAGCFTALHLPQEADILMITKADTEDSDSFLAQGGICVLKNESDYDAFYEDTMHAGHYENTPESVDIMIRSSRNVINQLIAWGVDFRRDENGELCYTKEGAHSTNRILFHDDVTGKEITSKLLAQVKKLPNVTLLAHTEMCDILSGKNGCEGVLIRDEEGKLVPVYARDVIWACGGIGGIYVGFRHFYHVGQCRHTYQLSQNFLLHTLLQAQSVFPCLILWVRQLQFLLQAVSFYSFRFSLRYSIMFLCLKIPVVHFEAIGFLYGLFRLFL